MRRYMIEKSFCISPFRSSSPRDSLRHYSSPFAFILFRSGERAKINSFVKLKTRSDSSISASGFRASLFLRSRHFPSSVCIFLMIFAYECRTETLCSDSIIENIFVNLSNGDFARGLEHSPAGMQIACAHTLHTHAAYAQPKSALH